MIPCSPNFVAYTFSDFCSPSGTAPYTVTPGVLYARGFFPLIPHFSVFCVQSKVRIHIDFQLKEGQTSRFDLGFLRLRLPTQLSCRLYVPVQFGIPACSILCHYEFITIDLSRSPYLCILTISQILHLDGTGYAKIRG